MNLSAQNRKFSVNFRQKSAIRGKTDGGNLLLLVKAVVIESTLTQFLCQEFVAVSFQ